MATKGASNHYGNARGGRQGHTTAHTGFAWAKDFNKKTLHHHFNDHGHQFGCNTQMSYAAHAVAFANNVDRVNCVSFVDKKGSTYKSIQKQTHLRLLQKTDM